MSQVGAEILEDLAVLADRPRDFTYWAWPWGEAGTELEGRDGPEPWQEKVLSDLQSGLISLEQAIELAVASGHGVGKSALIAMICWWSMSTAVDTRGRVTANTEKQLRTVLWPEIVKWHRLFIARDFFKVTATAIISADPEHEKNWRIDAVPWSEDNVEAFQGLHNYGKRLVLIMDEASGIHDKIWEALDGAMTDGMTQIVRVAFSNPTKNYGRFRDCFPGGRFENEWLHYRVDSRDVSFTNKKQIAKWIESWGEDSDFVRVRVRGEFPNASTLQLIPLELIHGAQARPAVSAPWESLILGVDVARFGANETVCTFRRGADARTIPTVRWQGLSTVESGNRIAGLIAAHSPDGVFIDEGGVGGGVVDFVRHLGHRVTPVNFGVPASTRPGGILVGNKRAEMFVALREWMREGGVIEADHELCDQLVSLEYHFNRKQEIMLVGKEDMRMLGLPSPDWADALALTFAYPVSAVKFARARKIDFEYDPFGPDALRVPEQELLN